MTAAMKHSMGQEISADDFENIQRFALQVFNPKKHTYKNTSVPACMCVSVCRLAALQLQRLCEQRRSLADYLSAKMEEVSPNLKALVGELLGARLISHAGALVSLAKYPASTIQILGAEKVRLMRITRLQHQVYVQHACVYGVYVWPFVCCCSC